jgi:hypothetical protein
MMRFNCDFEHRDTGECRTIVAALSAVEVGSIKALTKDADVIAEAIALRHAYAELPAGWCHTKPPEMILLS